ncbi:MAG: preprotein translocase, SecG subunit [Pseudomonadota bacterium]|jgi:preprotein translocase subunit SecG
MQTFLTVLHIVACILLIPTILIQSGKGAEISASFGGSSQTVFGSSGGANFFTRLTTTLALIFMCTSLALTSLSNQSKKSVFEGAVPAAPEATPTASASGAPEAVPTEQAPTASAEKPSEAKAR